MSSVIQKAITNFKKPTPQWLKNIFTTLLFLSGVWALGIPIFAKIPEEIKNEVNSWIVSLLPIFRFAIQFFKYDYSEETPA